MAKTNLEKVTSAFHLLRDGLRPFVEREVKAAYQDDWFLQIRDAVSEQQAANLGEEKNPKYDSRALLSILWNLWNEVFKKTLGPGERSLVNELRGFGNKVHHEEAFTSDDAYRALDSASRLLTAVSASEAAEIDKMKMEVLRLRFDEQRRAEQRKSSGSTIESAVTGVLTPWREVITPHPDVASGNYQNAEFAADLWQVHLGEGTAEYGDPEEFFRRTLITDSLKKLLVDAIRRIANNDGDPVVQLQTNFGGGKTHSMLALFHLFSGTPANKLFGVEDVLADAGVTEIPKVKKVVVLVGNKMSPATPLVKADGTVVRTLWGEIAYQLGGKQAFDRIRTDDEKGKSPGDQLRSIFNDFGPAVILIDEWVAYARQLHEDEELAGGTFETQFSFAQALTESAKLAKNCLLVISLPASDLSPQQQEKIEDTEVGGIRGRQALQRLQSIVGRVETSWQPATTEESFEIVRRRLFQPMTDPNHFKSRDVVTRAFADLYRSQPSEFPKAASEGSYEKRIANAYPIHPEVFDRLYSDWSSLPRFQRTRGVLRLMAAVIHSLWAGGDKNPLIMLGNIPIADNQVRLQLTRFLSEQWDPMISQDVDGEGALPGKLDGEVPNLGKYHACRRVARTIFMGSAPMLSAANKGVEDRTIKLGCAMPGEQPAIFGDALRRLAGAARFLYQDGPRYWYSTQPTVTKVADDRADEFKRHPEKVAAEIERRVKRDLTSVGDFSRIHPFPQTSADVQDDRDARLVVLGTDHPHVKDGQSKAEKFAREILQNRGNSPRIFQNTLVFIACDEAKLEDLEEAVRRYLAWESILEDQALIADLSGHQRKQAETQRNSADSVATSRVPEAFVWLIAPVQEKPTSPVEWNAYRLSGQDPLAQRASKKLRNDEQLFTVLGPTRLRMELDKTPLWDKPEQRHVSIANLADYFATYLYLPRLKNTGLLLNALQEGLKLLTWYQDSFAYAESYDGVAQRYRGLVCGRAISLGMEVPPGMVVKATIALSQIEQEAPEAAPTATQPQGGTTVDGDPGTGLFGPGSTAVKAKLTRYHATVKLDSTRVGRDASRVAEEVISHLEGLVGSKVDVSLEIEVSIPDGAPDDVVRIVTQNGRDLKFDSQGFESE